MQSGSGQAHGVAQRQQEALRAAISKCKAPQYWRAASQGCATCPRGKYSPFQGGESCYVCQKRLNPEAPQEAQQAWKAYCAPLAGLPAVYRTRVVRDTAVFPVRETVTVVDTGRDPTEAKAAAAAAAAASKAA